MKSGSRHIVLILVAALIIALAGTLYLTADRIAIYAISRTCNIAIAYGTMKSESLRRFDFTDFLLTDKKTGVGLLAKTAVVKPLWNDILAGKMAIDFKLTDVSFIKKHDEKQDDFETFEGLAALPFSSQWTYLHLSGALETSNGDIHLQDLKAESDVIKFTVTGDFRSDADIDSDITVYFSDALFAKIPKKYIKGVLKDEGDGWQSFSMKIKGNYKSPSIQVTGRQFRLNIGVSP